MRHADPKPRIAEPARKVFAVQEDPFLVTRTTVRSRTISLFVLAIALGQGCGPVSTYEEEYDRSILAYVDFFHVPDSSTRQTIQVTMRGSFGESSAFRFDRINIARTDTLFIIAAWGRETFRTGVQYSRQPVRIDTVLMLSTPLKGLHYVDLVAAQGVLRDSTNVY